MGQKGEISHFESLMSHLDAKVGHTECTHTAKIHQVLHIPSAGDTEIARDKSPSLRTLVADWTWKTDENIVFV